MCHLLLKLLRFRVVLLIQILFRDIDYLRVQEFGSIMVSFDLLWLY